MLLGIIYRFSSSFSALSRLNLAHDYLAHYKCNVIVILYFFKSCPEPPVCISGVGSFSVWCKVSHIFPFPLGLGSFL